MNKIIKDMKLEGIIVAVISLLSFFSCSMEDERILNDIDNQITDVNKGNVNAGLAFNVSMSAATTKSTTSVEGVGDSAIAETEKLTHCSILLLNAKGEVIAVRDKVTIPAGGTPDVTLALKEQDGVTVVVIANSLKTFATCESMDDINAVVQTQDDLSNLVKMGIVQNVSVKGSTYEDPKMINVEVQQLAARIELAEFNVTESSFVNTKFVDVTITGISLLNANQSCLTSLSNNEDHTIGITTVAQAKTVEVYKKGQGATALAENAFAPFYSFPASAKEGETEVYQTDDKAVTMQIDFTVGDRSFTKYYKIQHERGNFQVNSGYLYRLKVNMTVASDVIDFNISCTIADWQRNTIESEMEEF